MKKHSFFSRMVSGLSKTRSKFSESIDLLVAQKGSLKNDAWEELEELLITSDIGTKLTDRLINDLSTRIKKTDTSPEILREELKNSLLSILEGSKGFLTESPNPPTIVLVVGVNGTGKTTTIAKIGRQLKENDKTILFAAGDTFRDAAIEQLKVWGKRLDVEVVSQKMGADPAAVAYDALSKAKSKNIDYLFVDTAGRLHTKYNLMEELKKIKRVIEKDTHKAPHEILLTLDAQIGQNNITQATTFAEAIGVTGLVITKLDGTAKGGAVFALYEELKIPIKYIGIGEEQDDLERFDPDEFVSALTGNTP